MKAIVNSKDLSLVTAAVRLDAVVPYALISVGDKMLTRAGAARLSRTFSKETPYGKGECYEYTDDAADFPLTFSVTVGEHFALFDTSVQNRTDRNLYLSTIGFRFERLSLLEGDEKDYTLYSLQRDSAPTSLLDATKYDVIREVHPEVYEESLLLYTERGRCGFALAPVGEPRAYVTSRLEKTADGLCITSASDMCSVLVEPKECRAAQTMLLLDTEADAATRAIIEDYRLHLGARPTSRALSGWCSWYDKFFNIREEDVLSVIDYYRRHPELSPPDYVQIDEGWEKHWGEWGVNEKFSSGLPHFIKECRTIGARAGLWAVPIYVKEDIPLFANHPDWFAKKEDGSLAVYHNWLDGPCYGIDVTNPEARAFAVGVLAELYDLGIRYFKLDSNILYTNGKTSRDPKMTNLEATRLLYRDYAAALPEAHINACTAFFSRGVIGLCDSCRIAADVDRDYKTRRELINVYHQLPASAIKYAANGVLFDCDPDVLYLRGEARMNDHQRRIWLSFVSLYGGISGHSESPETLADSPDTAIIWPQPIERGRPVYPCDGDTVGRFGYIAKRSFGDFGVYLLWSDEDRDLPTDLSPVLSPLGERFHVFSFWEKKYLGVKAADFIIENAKAETPYLYRFTPLSSSDAPILVGSTLHVGMGAVEIESIVSADRKTTLTLGRYGAPSGSLFFYHTGALSLADEAGGAILLPRGDGVYEIMLSGDARPEQITLLYR